MTKHLLDSRWIKTLVSYDCIHVGFSGGLDSTVLLHALAREAELISKLRAVHINHGISPWAQTWQDHCQDRCERLGIPCETRTISLNRQANLEEEARHARYQVFSQLVKKNHCLLTAHHQDDHVETLLLHLFRGAGVQGLRGICETRVLGQGNLLRPLLARSRETLLAYANEHQLAWIEDESNADVHFSRNFVRQQVLPLLQTKWPGIRKNLVRTSELCQHAHANLNELAKIDCPDLGVVSTELEIKPLMHLSETRLSNVLRCWLQKNAVRPPNHETLNRLQHEVILADADANPEVRWDGWVIRRFRECLSLHEDSYVPLPNTVSWVHFPNAMEVSGLGCLSAQPAAAGVKIEAGDDVDIRFRQGGETLFWHGQTKPLKKLMQQWAIPTWLRARVPLIYVNQQLAAVVGYAVSDLFYSRSDLYCYEIFLSDRF